MTLMTKAGVEPLRIAPEAIEEAAKLLYIRALKVLPDDIKQGFTRPLMEREGVRIVIGKGGLREESLNAFREIGGVYLAIIGGTAALETTWIEAIEDVDLDDLNPESLWRFRIKDFGPLLVAMDSHGGSLYADVQRKVEDRRAAALAKLGVG